VIAERIRCEAAEFAVILMCIAPTMSEYIGVGPDLRSDSFDEITLIGKEAVPELCELDLAVAAPARMRPRASASQARRPAALKRTTGLDLDAGGVSIPGSCLPFHFLCRLHGLRCTGPTALPGR
jgi:hypothetical protein